MRDGKHLILCVDDDPDLLDLLRIHLEKGGYAVETAASGEEGMAKFKVAKPDLIIIDMMMEEIDAGTNLAKELEKGGSKIPALLLSSMGDQLNLSAGYSQLGLDGVFQKPVNVEALLRTIKARLAK